MTQRPVPPRGMRDLLPDEVLQRRRLLDRIIPVYESYGYQQIETPALEDINRLLGSGGGENEKLTYKVLKRGMDVWPSTEGDAVDLGLRYDLTVPLARFYATHSAELLSPFKSIQAGPVWRAERPQKGRYRQFMQCDIDVIGESSTSAEVELLTATAEALQACDAGEFTIRINDRRLLEALILWAGFEPGEQGAVLIALDKLDKIGVNGVRDELTKVNDGSPSKEMAQLLERLTDARGFDSALAALPPGLRDDAVDDLRDIVAAVAANLPSLRMEFDATLVRGMGYYTGAIFEVEHDDLNSSIAGGGRYDRMLGSMFGQDAPAAGFSIGFERLWEILASKLDAGERRRIVLLHDKEELAAASSAARALRRDGDVVRAEVAAKNRSAQLTRFTNAGFTHWAEYRNGVEPALQPLSKEGSP